MLSREWTEYQLYDTFLVGTGKFDRYHYYGDQLAGNIAWFADQFDDWDPLGESPQDGDFRFSLVQGAAGIPVADIKARLRQAGLVEG